MVAKPLLVNHQHHIAIFGLIFDVYPLCPSTRNWPRQALGISARNAPTPMGDGKVNRCTADLNKPHRLGTDSAQSREVGQRYADEFLAYMEVRPFRPGQDTVGIADEFLQVLSVARHSAPLRISA